MQGVTPTGSDTDAWEALPERRRRFVAEYIETGNGAEAARRAGYAPERARITASELVANSNVQKALDSLGLTPAYLASRMATYFDDGDKQVRSSAVRAGEILMRARGMLNADVQVNVDARSILLPGSEARSIQELEALASSLSAADDEVSPAGDTQE